MSDKPRSAAVVHADLQAALTAMRRAEKQAVLCFGEILRRRLYRDLGHSSIHMYARKALGFSQSKTYQFIRLAESLEELPGLRRSVERGEIAWTKARAVARIATPASESEWVAEARRSSRRALEAKVSVFRDHARRDRRADAAQCSLSLSDDSTSSSGTGSDSSGKPIGQDSATGDVHVAVSLKLDAMQLARFDTLVEKLRKQGHKESREDLMLEALGSLADEGADRNENCTRVQKTPYQLVIHRCECCGRAEIVTGRGSRRLDEATLSRIECEADLIRPGKRNQSTIPPARRREVLARDGHRCRQEGCGRTRFLELHHRVARSRGGGNEAENLVTLCSSCHQLIHEGKMPLRR